MGKLSKTVRLSIAVVLVFAVIFVVGCEQANTLNTEYGTIFGTRGADSLNGTKYFSELFEAQGATVKRSTVIDPKLDRYDTVVWFPDSTTAPSAKAVQSLSEWLGSGYDRTLIFVAGGNNATEDYLRVAIDKVSVEQKEEYLRRISEEMIENKPAGSNAMQAFISNGSSGCDWYELTKKRIGKKKFVSGRLLEDGEDFPDMELDFSYEIRPQPKWNPEVLLQAGDEAFVYKLSTPVARDNQNELILVSQGSILLNYSLIDEDKQALASALVNRCDTSQGVLFLESGSEGIAVRESAISNHSNWSWIAQPPLCYIVPHVLLLGVLFCFVYFPIFGRPKRVKPRNISTFRNHINATAELLSRSNQPNRAVNSIRDYQQAVSSDANRKKAD
ncbi:MAG: DUF4350 domain-containing protein [Planctomycetaceae bacterium]|nr:DUF4350 domain-containing protein [Planctomycetaceae bacterium]MCP4476523.1 DUF4350 domain-containing protein [Planctomycetaceae bacterium]MCP4773518.1 DUF4350 domain-containing protein [Planctomycetaceae bacterium]